MIFVAIQKRQSVFVIVLLISTFLFYFVAQAGEVENNRLFENIKSLNVEGVKKSLEEKADPNSLWSKHKRPMTAFGALAWSLVLNREDKENSQKAYEIAQALFMNGAKLSPFDTNILFFPISEVTPLTRLNTQPMAQYTRNLWSYSVDLNLMSNFLILKRDS